MDVRIFRVWNDDIPMQVTTLIRLNVSGQPRELRFPGVIPAGSFPMSLRGILPVKLGPEGGTHGPGPSGSL